MSLPAGVLRTAAGRLEALRHDAGLHPRHVLLFGVVTGLLAAGGPRWVAGVAAAGAAAVAVGRLRVAVAIAVLAGAVGGEARLAALDAGVLPALHGRYLTARAELAEPVRDRLRPATARARLLTGPAAGEQVVLKLRIPAPRAWPQTGAIVAVGGRVRPLGRYDAHQRRRGARAALDTFALRATGARRDGLAGVLDAVRGRAERGLERSLPPPEAALLRGMVLGQDELIEAGVREDFRRSGLAHLLAVSGQNVMLLALLVLAAGAACGLGLRTRLVVAVVLIAVYVPLAGGGPSIQRAGVMGAAGLVAALAGRPASRWYALGLAAAVTLALNPRAAADPGWQLSFAAVVGLLALAAPLRDAAVRRGVPALLAEAGALTLAATVATAPLLAFHFGQVSLASLPANLLAAPAVAPLMWLGMVAAALAQVAPALAAPFNALNSVLLGYLEWLAHAAAAPPSAAVSVRLPGPAALAVAYAALAAVAAAVRVTARRGSPLTADGIVGARAARDAGVTVRDDALAARDTGVTVRDDALAARDAGAAVRDAPLAARDAGAAVRDAPLAARDAGAAVRDDPLAARDAARAVSPVDPRASAPRRRRLAAPAVVTALVVAAVATTWPGGRDAPSAALRVPGELVVSFLDVGQGDATLLERDGTTVLVDTGPPDGPILRRLEEAGVRRIDVLVLTHAEADHEGAARAVLRAHRVGLVVDGGAGWDTATQRALPAAAARAGARVVAAHAGQRLAAGGIAMRVLWPPAGPVPPETNPNDRALVVHVRVGSFDLLLPADAESPVTAPLELPAVEALKVAHHGSADEGLPALLARLRPAVAAIEVGRRNTYGHPTASTLAALRVVPNVVRTDRDGTVRLRVSDRGMRLEKVAR